MHLNLEFLKNHLVFIDFVTKTDAQGYLEMKKKKQL